MAYIEKTAFWPRVTYRVFDETLNITGKFQNGDKADEICSAGFLCVKDELMDCEGYVGVGPTGSTVTIKNSNSWNMKATGAAVKSEGDGIFSCFPYDVNWFRTPRPATSTRSAPTRWACPLPRAIPSPSPRSCLTGTRFTGSASATCPPLWGPTSS